MGRGPRWTEDEDRRLEAVAATTAEDGRTLYDEAPLRRLAAELGRTYDAVRARASRIGARSNRDAADQVDTGESWIARDNATHAELTRQIEKFAEGARLARHVMAGPRPPRCPDTTDWVDALEDDHAAD